MLTTTNTPSPFPTPLTSPPTSVTVVPNTPSAGQTATTSGESFDVVGLLFFALILSGLGALIYYLYKNFSGI